MAASRVVRPPVSRCGAFLPLRSTQSRAGFGSSVRFPRVSSPNRLIGRANGVLHISPISPNTSQLEVMQAYYRLLREKQLDAERSVMTGENGKNYYEILGISPDATVLEVSKAFYRLWKEQAYVGKDKKLDLIEACDVLRNEVARQEYNMLMGIGANRVVPWKHERSPGIRRPRLAPYVLPCAFVWACYFGGLFLRKLTMRQICARGFLIACLLFISIALLSPAIEEM